MGDRTAYVVGGGASLAYWSELAGQLTPILSFIFLLMSIVWLGWRMWDKRFGKKSDG